jgi:DNA-directed RNA polymerase specialized sigma subunit
MDDEKLNYFIESSNTSSSEVNPKETSEYIFSILCQLKDKRIEKVFRMRYYSPDAAKTSWSAIAASLGVSTQTAINLHSRGAEVLKTKLRSENFFDTI